MAKTQLMFHARSQYTLRQPQQRQAVWLRATLPYRQLSGDVRKLDVYRYRLLLLPGCFSASLANDIPIYLNHRASSCITARTGDGSAVLRDYPDRLEVRVQLSHPRLLTAAEVGALDGISPGMTVTDSDAAVRDGMLVRQVAAAELFEVSIIKRPTQAAFRSYVSLERIRNDHCAR